MPTSNVCSYKICKLVAEVSRIRLDFTTFSINGPETAVNSKKAASKTDGMHQLSLLVNFVRNAVTLALNQGVPLAIVLVTLL